MKTCGDSILGAAVASNLTIPSAEGILQCCITACHSWSSEGGDGVKAEFLLQHPSGWENIRMSWRKGGLSIGEVPGALFPTSPPAELPGQSGPYVSILCIYRYISICMLCMYPEDGEGKESGSKEKCERQTCTFGISTRLSLRAPGSPWNSFHLRPGS